MRSAQATGIGHVQEVDQSTNVHVRRVRSGKVRVRQCYSTFLGCEPALAEQAQARQADCKQELAFFIMVVSKCDRLKIQMDD